VYHSFFYYTNSTSVHKTLHAVCLRPQLSSCTVRRSSTDLQISVDLSLPSAFHTTQPPYYLLADSESFSRLLCLRGNVLSGLAAACLNSAYRCGIPIVRGYILPRLDVSVCHECRFRPKNEPTWSKPQWRWQSGERWYSGIVSVRRRQRWKLCHGALTVDWTSGPGAAAAR